MDSYPPMIADTPQEQAKSAALRKKHAQPGQLAAAVGGLDPWAQLVQQAQGPVNPSGPMTHVEPPIRPGMLDAATAGMGPPPNSPPQVQALRSPQAGAMMSQPQGQLPPGQQAPPPPGAQQTQPRILGPSMAAQIQVAPEQQKLYKDQMAQYQNMMQPDTTRHYGWLGGLTNGLGDSAKAIVGSIKAQALRQKMQDNLDLTQQNVGTASGAANAAASGGGSP